MKRINAVRWIFLLCSVEAAEAQTTAGLSRADYRMQVELDDSKHRIKGTQEIAFQSGAADTLHELFFHLYFNAFQPGTAMAERTAALPDPDGRMKGRFESMSASEQGWNKVRSLKVNGVAQRTETRETTLKVYLDKPIPPGGRVRIDTEFEAQVPVQIRRSGRDNNESIDYTCTQWYPKLAQYDRHGWKTLPYVNREFFGIFGNFDVRIRARSAFVLAGTGVLVNACALPAALAQAYCPEAKGPKAEWAEWHFSAENVHDFAWAADRDYRISATQSGRGTDLYFARGPRSEAASWKALQDYTVRFFNTMDTLIGGYPYPRFTVIQGGDGGMEYPMCTMVLGAAKPDQIEGFVGLMVHEAAHNWFYGIIATDEQRYPWMDEGFTSYAEAVVMEGLFPTGDPNPHRSAVHSYRKAALAGLVEPLSTPADFYTRNKSYGMGAYVMGELFLWQLEGMVGTPVFRAGLREFYRKYAFTHPEPSDLVRILERRSGMQLQWYSDLWTGTTQTIDHGIVEVRAVGRDQIRIVLERKGSIPMPLELVLVFEDGTRRSLKVPLDWCFEAAPGSAQPLPFWNGYAPRYECTVRADFNALDEVQLDPLEYTADLHLENNRWVKP
ncbi:M1 family peptidase [bacterium]|nr:M1 family peptidase [bacterium]